jgi:hypothetical protein
MNEIINMAIDSKLLNINNNKVIELLNKKNKNDKVVDILTIEVSKLLVGLIKLER